jgi:hypothetical protein
MASIDFQRIRSTPKSRNDSFEALAVHLFKVSCPVPTNSIFYSLRGDGGDGGVEGYFVTPTDSKFGVQAKYFFKLGTSELRQISDSLRAALENHPSLTNYWVYIPFDLTGRKSAGRRGISEVERFEKWKNSVESTARKDGKQLTVLLCSASTISDQILSNDKHGGVRRYWFDDAVLTPASIIACLNQAKAFAGPRYTEGLDVVTHAHKTLDFFGGTGDFDYWRKSALGPALATAQRLAKRSGEIFSVLPADECERASRLLALAISRSVLIEDAHGVASLVQSTREVLAELRPLASQARELQEKTFAEKHGAEHDTPSLEHHRRVIT